MIYRVSVRANPRLLLLFFVVPALPLAGVLATVFIDRTLGIIGLAVAIYMCYHLVKFLSSHLRSFIETDGEALKCRTTANEEIILRWDSVTHAGRCYPAAGPQVLFVYSDAEDRLLTIPREYAGYDDLVEEVRSRTGAERFRELELAADESLKDRLKAMLER